MSDVLEHVRDIGFRPRTVIDIGVAEGTFPLYETFPEATHFLVEPLKEYEGVLRDICSQYNAQYVVAAATDRPGTQTIHVRPDLYSSSIFHEQEGRSVDGVEREVPTVTIDDLCRDKRLQGPYLIKIDAQGAELLILDGAMRTLPQTELIILEISLFDFLVGGPQLFDVVKYMKDRGYVVYDVFGGLLRPLDDALAQVDMAFVKEFGVFRKSRAYATPEQRAMINEWAVRWRRKRG